MAREKREKKRGAVRTAEPQSYRSFESWSERAVRRIWLPKERERVRAELADHYEDRLEDWKARGLSGDEAVRKAVECLGDPEETAVLLSRVHQPWLSVLVGLARGLLILLALAGALFLVQQYLSLRPLRSLDTQAIADRNHREGDGAERTTVARRNGSCSDSISCGPFQVAFEAGSYRWDYTVYRDERYGGLTTRLETECRVVLSWTAKPWERMPSDLVERIVRVEDSNGVKYRHLADSSDWDMTETAYFQSTGRVRPNAWASAFHFYCMEEEPDWLDFIFDAGTGEKRLRVYFGPREFLRGELEPIGDPEQAVEDYARADRDALLYSQLYTAASTRPGAEAGSGEGPFSVPWCRQTVYDLDEQKLEQARRSYDLSVDLPAEEERVECVLLIANYPDSFPVDTEELWEQLRIEAEGVSSNIGYELPHAPLFYADACLLRLEWTPLPGVERYELVCTDPQTGRESRTAFVLGQEEISLRKPKLIGDAERAVEAFARSGGGYLPYFELYSAQSYRLGAEEEGGDEAISVPWCRQSLYRLDGDKLEEAGWSDGAPEGIPETGEVVECVVLFRDYPDSFPRDTDIMWEQLWVSAPGVTTRVGYSITVAPQWYDDACLLRLEWMAPDGVNRYELVYTDPQTGERARTAFVLGEEEIEP